ncbi:Vitamin B12 dependent methionine synthase activation subunit [Desulforamulus ruminis]|nr:Vitamin B12 dependent methionine synthase activation subunit [Desulforamulus ruminis]
MMLLSQIPVRVKYQQVLRMMGQPAAEELSAQNLEKIKPLLNLGQSLLHAAAFFSMHHFWLEENILRVNERVFHLAAPSNELVHCRQISVIAVTAGEEISRQGERFMHAGEMTAAFILDAVGTVAVEEAANYTVNLIARQQRLQGLHPTPRFLPGCRGFSLQDLPALLSLAKGERLGITCNDHFQMTPVKSLVFLVGWSAIEYKLASKCAACPKRNCQYRQSSMEGENQIVL